MKFNKKLKKGFTLVELIVVIAIVAILAAVSVVSYIAFINSANESADIQLVKQLNTCLQADEALHGKKDWSEDYQGLRDLLEGNGFIVENLTKTKSGCDMVYQSKTDDETIINRYALLKGEDVIYSESTFASGNNHRNFWIPETAEEAQDLSDEGKGVVLGSEIGEVDLFEAHASVIVNGAKVDEIQYSHNGASQKVVICTDGGKLVVNAPSDTVTHYGLANVVDVNDVASNTYKENGTVSELNINTNDHVEILSDATVYKMTIAETVTTLNISVSDDAILGVLFNESSATVSGIPQSVKVIDESTIDIGPGNSSTAYVGTAEAFKTAVENPEINTIKLTDDITIPADHATSATNKQAGTYILRDGLTINGQGFEIKCADNFPLFKVKYGWGEQSGRDQGYVSIDSKDKHENEYNIFFVAQGSTVTIENLFIDGNDKPKHCINCFGNMIIEDVVIHGFRGSAFNANGNQGNNTGDAWHLNINATRLSAYDCIWSTMTFDKGAPDTTFNINLKDCTIINEHTKAAKYGDPTAYEYALKFDNGGNYVASVVVDGGYIESILTNDKASGGENRTTNIIYK